MKHIIDPFYFVGDLDIAGTEKSTVRGELCPLIEEKQVELLSQAMGHGFAAAMLSALEQDPVGQRWQELLDGGVWLDSNGHHRHFTGLKRLIGCYVYWHWQKMNVTSTQVAGETVAKVENSRLTSPGYKMKDRWNELAKAIHELWYLLDNRRDAGGALLYPEYDRTAVCHHYFRPVNMMGI